MKVVRIICSLVVLLAPRAVAVNSAHAAGSLKDILWVWATPNTAEPGPHTLDTFAQAPAAQRAELLGTPNIIMAGTGLPQDWEPADRLTSEVAKYPHLVWEIGTDSGGIKPPFAYDQTVARLAKLARKYPQIEGVLLDDMTSVGIGRGFKPEHLKRLRRQLTDQCPDVKLWGVLYSMNFGEENLKQYIGELDVINLWVWDGKDLADLEKYVAHCENTFPGKPIVLGLYLRDYGSRKPMPQALMEQQCETARKLAHAGRIQGIVFLTIDNDPPIVRWTADWIRRVGAQPLGRPATPTHSDLRSNESAREDKVLSAAETTKLGINTEEWAVVEGAWQQDAEGVITGRYKEGYDNLAFFTGKAYQDFEAEFDFLRQSGHAGVGLAVRAQDSRHYYVVSVPFTGQQIREGHFWAAVGKVDGTGWQKVLKLESVPGVPAEAGLWNRVKVVVEGDEIRLWVNDRPFPVVQDNSYTKPGYIGLVSWGSCKLKNLQVRGTSATAAPWNNSLQPLTNWFTPYPTKERKQGSTGLTRAANGDLLLVINNSIVRSKDQGRTWQKVWHKDTDNPMGIGTLAATQDGRVILVRVNHLKPFAIEVASSSDNGNTWSEFEKVGELKLAEVIKEAYTYGQILELKDGTLLHFGYTYPPFYKLILENGRRYRQAPVPGMMSFCIRSTDGGRSWSNPVDIDGPNPSPKQWMSFKDGPSEVTGMETREGEIVAFRRPGVSWAMWETRSKDGGLNWTPLATGPFLSYATAAVPRATASGALVVGGRFPGLALYVSMDNGMTWTTYQIDTEIWAMGGMYEVAPDVVLWVYASGSSQLRAQFIRITPKGAEPARDILPTQ